MREPKAGRSANGHVWKNESGFGDVCQRCRSSKTFGGEAFKSGLYT